MPNLFFFNDTATTEIYTLSLHDALPICALGSLEKRPAAGKRRAGAHRGLRLPAQARAPPAISRRCPAPRPAARRGRPRPHRGDVRLRLLGGVLATPRDAAREGVAALRRRAR